MNRKFSPFLAQYSAHLQACQLFVSFSTVVWGNKIWLQSSSMLFSLYSSCKTPRAYLHYSRLLFNYEVFVRRRSSRSRPSSQKVIARMRLLHKIKCFLIKSSVAPSPPHRFLFDFVPASRYCVPYLLTFNRIELNLYGRLKIIHKLHNNTNRVWGGVASPHRVWWSTFAGLNELKLD